MKRRVSGSALGALVLATITGCSLEYDGGDAVTHEFGSDYFGAGGMLNLTDPIEGDAILAGGRVAIASEIKGDVVAAGGELSVGGAVGDDLYAAGGNVQVDALGAQKTYLAVAELPQAPPQDRWVVENRLARGEPRFRMTVVPGDVNARSLIELVERRGTRARFRLQPLTGKTHQCGYT